MIVVRPAHPLDARQMADLLNAVIQIGGTTALSDAVTREDIQDWMQRTPDLSSWHVAESETGMILGFQWITGADYLLPDAAEIATFAAPGNQGLGIGSKLFEATRAAAKRLGYAWISANIRADNAGGLAYYQSRGFEDYGKIEGYQMADGRVVDKILKRLDL